MFSGADNPLKFYSKFNVPEKTLYHLNIELALVFKGLTKAARDKRKAMYHEALTWPSGPDQENRKVTVIYNLENYAVAIGKPGKEAHPEFKSKNYKTGRPAINVNDMNPMVLLNGQKTGRDLTFEDMFHEIELLNRADEFGLELLACLLYRLAFMVDHVEVEGKIRYKPPAFAMAELKHRLPLIAGVPADVFVHFLDVLGLNEDIKVTTLGHDEFTDYGRINTILTFVHLIAVLLHRSSLAKFAGQFARPPSGMAPIAKTKIGEFFPLLNVDFEKL